MDKHEEQTSDEEDEQAGVSQIHLFLFFLLPVSVATLCFHFPVNNMWASNAQSAEIPTVESAVCQPFLWGPCDADVWGKLPAFAVVNE